jgi:HEAT repeat protein
MANKVSYKIILIVIVFIIHSQTVISAELSKNIIVIARHGSLEDTPENTFVAFEKAINIGVGGLEIDVRKTKDDKLILMHDDTIDRTTDGKGYVSNLLYDEIKQYDAGAWKGKEFTGEEVPLLSDVLQFTKEKNIKIILNVKEHGIEQQIMSLIREFDMLNQIYFGGTLAATRSTETGIQGAKLVFVLPNKLTNDTIELVHERHNHIGTSLINSDDRDKMKERMIKGVDVILTDYPSVAIDLLHYKASNQQKRKNKKSENKLKIKRNGNERQVHALVDIMIHESPDKSRMAALAMSTLPQEISVPPLIQLLAYKKSLKRFNPIRKIISTFKKEKDDSPPSIMVRRNAAWALGFIGDKSAVEPLVMQLKTGDSELKREIMLALKRIADRQTVKVLNEVLLNEKDPHIRYDAARALGEIKDADSIYTLITALKYDRSWIVKKGCAGALGKIGSKKAVNSLKALLTTDAGKEASWARNRAAWALAKIGEDAIRALVSSLGDNEKSTRRRASWALIRIGNPAVPYLISSLRDTSKSVRERSAMVLGWIRSRDAIVPLLRALKDKDTEARKMAAWALGRIGGVKAVVALERAFGEQDERDEKINNRISILTDQLGVLNDLFAVSDKKRIQIAALERAFGKEDEKTNNQLKVLKDRFVDLDIDMVQSDITELIVMMANKEDRKNKIIASIKNLKKELQENKEVTEYAKEAIQRIRL